LASPIAILVETRAVARSLERRLRGFQAGRQHFDLLFQRPAIDLKQDLTGAQWPPSSTMIF